MPLEVPPGLEGHDWSWPGNYMGLPPDGAAWSSSSVAILPIPYEATTSWGTGARDGPAAAISASRYIEKYDEELGCEPYSAGICTLPDIQLGTDGPQVAIDALRRLYDDLLEAAGARLVIGIGGEHSISAAPITAWQQRLGGGLTVLQFDAHADLRDTHRGSRWNHACVMRRVLEHGVRIVAVGLRGITTEESRIIQDDERVTGIFAHEMKCPHRSARGVTNPGSASWVDHALSALGQDVYITFDVDFFDPAFLPATGTPEPGGGDWWDAVALLSRVFEERNVVGVDVVELAPRPGEDASTFNTAKLIYKMIGFHTRTHGLVSGVADRSG